MLTRVLEVMMNIKCMINLSLMIEQLPIFIQMSEKLPKIQRMSKDLKVCSINIYIFINYNYYSYKILFLKNNLKSQLLLFNKILMDYFTNILHNVVFLIYLFLYLKNLCYLWIITFCFCQPIYTINNKNNNNCTYFNNYFKKSNSLK